MHVLITHSSQTVLACVWMAVSPPPQASATAKLAFSFTNGNRNFSVGFALRGACAVSKKVATLKIFR
jgi:hypothetical protein